MRAPIQHRSGIPFYYNKSESEFRQDVYERYDDIVSRQTALHMAPQLWPDDPMQPAWNFISRHVRDDAQTIVEIGCSVGKFIGTVAEKLPSATCWGIDYSYQLLRRAKELWLDGKMIQLDLSIRGMPKILIHSKELENLNFGLAKAEDLPFDDAIADVIFSSYLIDRLEDPKLGLQEMYRVLKNGGRCIFITPLNFTKASHWKEFYPAQNLLQTVETIGFTIAHRSENLMIFEPLDLHGNTVMWKCLAVVAVKQ